MAARSPKLFDMVAVTRLLEGQPLEVGDVGTIVELFGQEAAEVEFVNPEGKTWCVATCPFTHLLLLNHRRTRVA